MNFSRLILISGSVLFGVISVYTFIYLSKSKPFYIRLRKKKRLYQLVNTRLSGSTLIADLTHGKTVFTLRLSFINDEIINFQVNDSKSSRYVVQDAVILHPTIREDIVVEQDDIYLHVYNKTCKITINCNNFKINVLKDNELLTYVENFVIEEKEPYVGISADFLVPDAVTAYGLPQHAEKLSLKPNENKPYRLFNADRFAYSTANSYESLYGAVPLVYAYNTQRTTGILWLNASETYVCLAFDKRSLKTTFYSESGAVDFYILTGPNLQDCVRQNSQLTGVVPLPPLFALGYHQSRYSYMSQNEVIEVSNRFDKEEFPLDSIWLDIDYTDDKKYFTWHPTTYPNPQFLLDFLESKRRKAVVIIDPHIKVDDNYPVYTQCRNGDFLVKNHKGSVFTAKCWPGTSSWIDFFNPEARQFYADLHRNFARSRNLHIWNDMNEPALFETEENSMPKNALHYGNWKHRDVHNLYGFYQTMATYEGLMQRPNLRPFVLTRSHFVGSQRYAAIWTGDNTASWEHLRISIPMCLTASLSGFSLCGADIGGFVKHPDEELLQRWYQLGAWLPFFRGHSNRNVPRREPYLYDNTVQNTIRASLKQRYMHLLHWYTLFWQHYISLEPVIRPLIYQYPNDEKVLNLDGQFLVGNNILVCPVTEPQVKHISVYLPGGDNNELWYYTDAGMLKGNQHIKMPVDISVVPVFYRGGSIIPVVESKVSSSFILKDCPITLYIFCDRHGTASGTLYVDDTESFQYLERDYHYVRFDLEDTKISNIQLHQNLCYDSPIILNSIKLYGYDKNVTTASIEHHGINRNLKVAFANTFMEIKDLNINLQQKFIITLSQ